MSAPGLKADIFGCGAGYRLLTQSGKAHSLEIRSARGLSALARLGRDPLRPESRSRSSDLANEPTHGELPACVLSQSVDGFLQGDCGVVALSVVPV